jgi:hypothetical protein
LSYTLLNPCLNLTSALKMYSLTIMKGSPKVRFPFF